MSGRHNGAVFPLLNVPDVTAAGSFTSSGVQTGFVDNIGMQCSWSANVAGTIVVQGSLDNGTTWTSLDVEDEGGNPPAPSGAAGSLLIRITEMPYPLLRLVLTVSGGTGTFLAYMSSKMI